MNTSTASVPALGDMKHPTCFMVSGISVLNKSGVSRGEQIGGGREEHGRQEVDTHNYDSTLTPGQYSPILRQHIIRRRLCTVAPASW